MSKASRSLSKARVISQQAKAPSLGLALGGGGARGFAHIAILETLDELGVRPDVIAGTSIGALFGAAYAAGMTGKDIREYCEALFLKRTAVARKIFSYWNESWLAEKNPMNGSPFSAENIITALLPETVPKRFEELKTPLLTVSTDFYAQCQHVIGEGDLIPAVAASCALPAIFRPIQMDGHILIDGGFVNAVPFDVLCDRVDVTAAIDVTAGPQHRDGKIPSLIDVIIGSAQITMRSVVNEKLNSSRPDIFVRADIGQFGVLEFYKFEAIYAASAEARDEFKRAIEAIFDKNRAARAS